MNEDFLHYLWKHKKFTFSNLTTTNNEEVILKRVGDHNQTNPGPDFFNAQLIIADQRWAGNIEIHVKSSDWYVHHHEVDPIYDNVILHVVWEDDIEIFRKDNTRIPSLELQKYVDKNLVNTYEKLFMSNPKKWVQCEYELPDVSTFTISHWQERLYLERLEQKSLVIKELLENSSNDWEAVLFKMLAKNFGLNVNNEPFLSLAASIDFSVVRKCSNNLNELEALFFGQADLLRPNGESSYERELYREYVYLKNKFKLENQGVLPFQFFRLRPPNFPTIRLSQLANLYYKNKRLFNAVIETSEIEDFYKLLDIATSDFWENHYTFNKQSSFRKKRLTKSFIHLILINTVIPVKFLYAKSRGEDPEEKTLSLMSQMPAEKNTIIDKFAQLGVEIEDGVHSQAMIQLKNQYCDKKACLNCEIGNYLLNQEPSLG